MFGLYIHWPFCLSKCIYCDFGSKIINKNDCNNKNFQHQYYLCLKKQLNYFADKLKNINQLTTIYFGGGTPSLLNPEIVYNIINDAKQIYGLSNNCEITLETNPTSFETQKFKNFKDAGINRLSLGVQSMNNNNLIWLGRKHNIEQAITAINEIKLLFPKWSFDLIYGLPKQSLNDWLKELKQALSLKPQHLSLYTLIVDDNTPLGKMVQLKNIIPKTNDEMADFYQATNQFIKQNSNLIQYEVSNYALDRYECQHNMNYWKNYDYIGIGAGAHGRLTYKNDEHYEIINIFEPTLWINNISNNSNGLEIQRKLNKKEQAEEIIIMETRTKYGIDIEDINNRFKINILNFINMEKLNFFKKNNFLIFQNNNIKITSKGIILLDEIIRQILK